MSQMSTNPSSAEDFEHICIHFDASSADTALTWVKTGEVALGDAVAELYADGAVVTQQRVPGSHQDSARGLGYDLLIGITSSLASTLLLDLFAAVVANIFSRYPRPAWITIQSETRDAGAEVALRADDDVETVRAKIGGWLQHVTLRGHKLTIRLH